MHTINILYFIYFSVYDADLEEDLKSDTSGYFRRLMVSLVTAGRQEEDYSEVDYDKAREDAQKFFDVISYSQSLEITVWTELWL